MAPRKAKPERVRNRRALLAVNTLAVKVNRAMSHDLLVSVQVASRPPRRVLGRIVACRVREGWKPAGVDGETGLEFDIVSDEGRETIALGRVQSIERQRVAPAP